MSSKKDHEFKENLEKCYNILLQSSTKGISAADVAKKLGKHRTTIHSYLNTLQYRGRVYSEHGIWYAKKGEQPIKPLEKEIVIELPIPKSDVQRLALLEYMAKDWEEVFKKDDSIYRAVLDKFKETRTIKIKGKNVDDLDLEKLGNLIQQATKKSSKFNLKGLFKGLKMSRPNNTEEQPKTA